MLKTTYEVIKRPEETVEYVTDNYKDAMEYIRQRESVDVKRDEFEPETYYLYIRKQEVTA